MNQALLGVPALAVTGLGGAKKAVGSGLLFPAAEHMVHYLTKFTRDIRQ
jgi:hypothetical protein